MCFKNLPIEFDAQGRARLKEGLSNPYAYESVAVRDPEEIGREAAVRNGYVNGSVKQLSIDPVTRVAGALAFHATIDLPQRRVLDARSVATLFRGYEVVIKGRDPRDAIDLSSRACGVCGGVHATTSSYALEMALGIKPPPLGVVVRNLGEAAEFLYDHPLHMFLLAGPDYSEMAVRAATPGLWEAATRTEARHAAVHGFRTIGEIMHALNPLTGSLYLEAIEVTRKAREMVVLMLGKFPHPSTLVPGGVTTTVSITSFNEYYTRLLFLFDYAKKVALLWDDVFDFFYEHDPRYREVGALPANFANTGIWDDPDAYDATYENCAAWGERRWSTPGIVLDGRLVTTNLQHINLGLEEFIEHAYYESWEPRFRTDPLGAPLSPYHPWNKETRPRPTGRSWKDKYTWSTAPRWDRHVVETGPSTRLYVTALARKLPPNPFIEATGESLRLALPKVNLPELHLEWQIPSTWNAFERNRGRAYAMVFTALVAMNNLLKAFDLLKHGETRVSTPFEVPARGTRLGAGFWEAGRGWLTHHVVIDNGKVSNYQIVTPSTIMASPLDPVGQPGPYEQAVMNTPILEEFRTEEDFKGIDILRAIRSFDPCMPCTTHLFAGRKTVVREVNTCACGLEG